MFNKIFKVMEKAQFDFSFPYNIVAVFVNPFFFVRKNLYYNIRKFAHKLDGKLLDFGCGCKPYKNFFSECEEYIGLDIDDRGHKHQNEQIDVYYDGKKIPFEDGYFDSLFTTEVYEHVPDLQEILPEINRVLKMGGYMIVTVPFVWNEHESPYDFRRFTQYGIKLNLEEMGFKIIKIEKSTGYIEMIFQLYMEYIRHSFSKLTDNAIIMMIVQLILCAPVIVFGSIVNWIFPKNESLYGDSIVLCQKETNICG